MGRDWGDNRWAWAGVVCLSQSPCLTPLLLLLPQGPPRVTLAPRHRRLAGQSTQQAGGEAASQQPSAPPPSVPHANSLASLFSSLEISSAAAAGQHSTVTPAANPHPTISGTTAVQSASASGTQPILGHTAFPTAARTASTAAIPPTASTAAGTAPTAPPRPPRSSGFAAAVARQHQLAPQMGTSGPTMDVWASLAAGPQEMMGWPGMMEVIGRFLTFSYVLCRGVEIMVCGALLHAKVSGAPFFFKFCSLRRCGSSPSTWDAVTASLQIAGFVAAFALAVRSLELGREPTSNLFFEISNPIIHIA